MFELIPKGNGYWTEKTLASFPNEVPVGPVIMGADGNVYGATTSSSHHSDDSRVGRIFKLSPNSDGSWTKTTLRRFNKVSGGYYPATGIVFDQEGNLYGITTRGGGRHGNGLIFKLSPQQDGSWTETVLYNFENPSGGTISTGLIVDPIGNLIGTAGGVLDPKNVFRLTKPKTERGKWSHTILHTFPAYDGDVESPNGVILDASGNLYGTAASGGPNKRGAVFEIPAGGGANGPDKLLYSFRQGDHYAFDPSGPLVFDHAGNLYGTTAKGGPYSNPFDPAGGSGKMFELLPRDDGSWAVKALYEFGGRTYQGMPYADGCFPFGALVIGPDGDFYGVTGAGGYNPDLPPSEEGLGYGTVFKFVMPKSIPQ